MNNETNRNPISEDELSHRAVSIYGQGADAMDDFPVLRAFQQYVNAEQDKARKRLVSLSIVFAAIIIVMIAGFMFMLYGINMRNQALSDRLFEYAMRDSRREASAAAAQPLTRPLADSTPKDDAQMKAITEALAEMQRKLDRSVAEQPKVQVHQQTEADLEYERKIRKEADNLEKFKASLELEKRKLEDERKRLHDIEVDRQLRKLYPELYGEKKETPTTTRSKPKRELSDSDIQDILKEAYSEDEAESDDTETDTKKPAATKTPSEDDAIEYFKDDEYNLSIGVKGTDQKVDFVLPVE